MSAPAVAEGWFLATNMCISLKSDFQRGWEDWRGGGDERCAVCGVEGLNWRNFSTVPRIFFQDVAGLKIVQFFSISVGNGRRFVDNVFHWENFSSMSHNFCSLWLFRGLLSLYSCLFFLLPTGHCLPWSIAILLILPVAKRPCNSPDNRKDLAGEASALPSQASYPPRTGRVWCCLCSGQHFSYPHHVNRLFAL